MLLPFQGATAPTRDTQGVATLALGSVLHWAFSPHRACDPITHKLLSAGKRNDPNRPGNLSPLTH